MINECCRFVAQTFTSGRTGVLTGVNINVEGFRASRLHVAIRTVVDGVPSATVLGETILESNSALLSQLITFPQTIEVTIGRQYAIVVDYDGAPPPGPGQAQGGWTGATGDAYPRGALLFSESGHAWFGEQGFDVNFQTYVRDATAVDGHGRFNTDGEGRVDFTVSNEAVTFDRSRGERFSFVGEVESVTGSGNSATVSGAGSWNGVRGYSFEASLVDNGSPGSLKDTIEVVIRDAQGTVVFTSFGAQLLKPGDITVSSADSGTAFLRVTFTYPDSPAADATFFRSEGSGSGLLPGSAVTMWARYAPATISPWLGEDAGQTIRVNGGTVEANGTTIRPDEGAFFGNHLRCSAPVGPFPGQLWDQIWVTGTSAAGGDISSPLYTYQSTPALPC